ncbi:hypothetical protein V6N13_142125 [Hibiscus sabdariffa]
MSRKDNFMYYHQLAPSLYPAFPHELLTIQLDSITVATIVMTCSCTSCTAASLMDSTTIESMSSNPQFKLFIVHVKSTASSIVGLIGPGIS